jgi:hypothetical protein
VREAFGAFDEDGDGLLDVNDVQSFFEVLGESLVGPHSLPGHSIGYTDRTGRVIHWCFQLLTIRPTRVALTPRRQIGYMGYTGCRQFLVDSKNNLVKVPTLPIDGVRSQRVDPHGGRGPRRESQL